MNIHRFMGGSSWDKQYFIINGGSMGDVPQTNSKDTASITWEAAEDQLFADIYSTLYVLYSTHSNEIVQGKEFLLCQHGVW